MSEPAEPGPPPPTDLGGRVSEFFNNMDERAWRAIAVSVVLLVIAGAMLVVGRLYFGDQINAFIDGTLGQAQRQHWGLWATILVFTLTSFVGAPQFVLISACVVAFKPEHGFWYAWIATIVSGVVNYWVGYLTRAHAQKHFSGSTGGRFTHFMGKNTFLASALIRNVPSAPFIVVNMAFGVARANFWAFLAGMAVGVLPKTAIVAFGFDVILDAMEGKVGSAVVAGVAGIVIWLVGVVLVRRWLRRREERKKSAAAATQDASAQQP
ncbi:MAG TPA: VTT domain-containing protein [Vitreimonas sp.]|jgi:uncharacterized membrane protein YdjX (TVP38/TMEM64 family)|nr:VTT domain-containing protein [Vitreimonas sp.]